MDLFGDPGSKTKSILSYSCLGEKGTAFEHGVVNRIEVPMLDLSPCSGDEKERLTIEALQRGERLIYRA